MNRMQVNLGNNEAWDTHGDNFPRLREKTPARRPTERYGLSWMIFDSTGLLDSTLIVMGGRIRPHAEAFSLLADP